jgi:hypothetical protein
MTADAKTQQPAVVEAALQKVLPFAAAADALARRMVGKVLALAVLGLIASLGITLACVDAFGWGLKAALMIFVVLVVPAAVLWKMHGTLRGVIGLPQRLVDTAGRLVGRAAELKQLYDSRPDVRDIARAAPGFRSIWQAGRNLLDAKSLGDEAQAITSEVAGAAVVANPVFAIVLAGASLLAIAQAVVACVVGLVYIF